MQAFHCGGFLIQNERSFSALFYFTHFNFYGNSVQMFIGNLF